MCFNGTGIRGGETITGYVAYLCIIIYNICVV